MRAIIFGDSVVAVHPGTSINKFKKNPKFVRELTKEEIESLGENARFVGPHNTSVDEEGSITFDFDSYTHLEDLARDIRDRRKKLLRDSDWRYLSGNDKHQSKGWDLYRQALRDITNQKSFPKKVIWPEPPLT
jgi:hypothetical protein